MVKVTRKEKAYIPVTVVLETQEEFDCVFGIFGAGTKDIMNECENFDYDIHYNIWDKLDDIKNE